MPGSAATRAGLRSPPSPAGPIREIAETPVVRSGEAIARDPCRPCGVGLPSAWRGVAVPRGVGLAGPCGGGVEVRGHPALALEPRRRPPRETDRPAGRGEHHARDDCQRAAKLAADEIAHKAPGASASGTSARRRGRARRRGAPRARSCRPPPSNNGAGRTGRSNAGAAPRDRRPPPAHRSSVNRARLRRRGCRNLCPRAARCGRPCRSRS